MSKTINVQSDMAFYGDLGPSGMWLRKDERLRWLDKKIPALIEDMKNLGDHPGMIPTIMKYEEERETLRSELA
ncbi:MAG: hypothetical protein PHN80_16345 [Hespellia sp.]|nr:hypothetical protein [Hespellia sp.]